MLHEAFAGWSRFFAIFHALLTLESIFHHQNNEERVRKHEKGWKYTFLKMLVHTLMLNKGSPAGLAIQAALARAIDRGKFAVVANLDLSCAFDLVNIKLLIKNLKPDYSTSVWEWNSILVQPFFIFTHFADVLPVFTTFCRIAWKMAKLNYIIKHLVQQIGQNVVSQSLFIMTKLRSMVLLFYYLTL